MHERSQRLASLLRNSDTVARLGGDEFTIILPDINHALDITLMAQKIISGFASPFDIKGYEPITLSTSIGIAICCSDNCDLATIVEQADAAMYFAKNGGKNNYRIYSKEMSVMATKYLRTREVLKT